MKKRNTHILALTAVAIAALTTTSANAAVTYGIGVSATSEAEVNSTTVGEYSGDESALDVLNGLTPTAVTGWFNADRGPDKLVDGLHGADGSVANIAQSSSGTASAIFDLGTGANGAGYDLTSILSIAAWGGLNFGSQVWTLEVKGVELTDTYSTLVSVDYQIAGANATKVTLTDLGGDLTSGVQFIRVTAQPNDISGNSDRFVWRELDIFGEATVVPEPSTTALLGLGGLALILRRRK